MQSHYNYVFDDITSTYNFVTKNNILYRVAFVVDESFSSISGEEIQNVYQLIVEKANEELEPFDAKVSRTIQNIIQRFFQQTENSLIYICSDDDHKSIVRHKIFSRWYKHSKYQEDIIKLDNIIKVDVNLESPQILYTSMMFHKKNTQYEKLISIYNQVEKALNEDK